MSETASTSFSLGQPGDSVVVPNSTFQSSGNLAVSYKIAGSAVVTVQGLTGTNTSTSDWGHQADEGGVLLDTYDGVSVSNRSVAVSALFNAFRVTWVSGATSVSGSLSSNGTGAAFSSSNLPAIQTYSA